MNEAWTPYLQELRHLLDCHGEIALADRVAKALSGTESELAALLTSNSLWGGAGSVADEAGMKRDRSQARGDVEAALIRLGEAQIAAGLTNVGTAGWVEAFKSWRRQGI